MENQLTTNIRLGRIAIRPYIFKTKGSGAEPFFLFRFDITVLILRFFFLVSRKAIPKGFDALAQFAGNIANTPGTKKQQDNNEDDDPFPAA
jgi:hypothetical protein